MERVPQLVRRGKKDRRMGAPSELDWAAIEALRTGMRVELIQELIPLGLAEVGRVLDEEVERLAGPRHARKGEGEVIYQHGRLRQRVEDLPVQQLVPELAVEALVVAVLPRATESRSSPGRRCCGI